MQQLTNYQSQQPNIAELARMLNCFDEASIAFLAGVKLATVEAWRKRGKGPEYILFGCNYLYPIPAIERYLASLLRPRSSIDPKSILLN